MNRRELANFLLFLMHRPNSLISTLAFYIQKMGYRVLRRVNRESLYPRYISRSLLQNVPPEDDGKGTSEIRAESCGNVGDKCESEELLDSTDREEVDGRILLARGEVDLDSLEEAWQIESADVEESLSLHRWNWLLTKLTMQPSVRVREWGLQKVQAWLKTHQDRRVVPAWETYSTGERLVNALIFCMKSPAKPGNQMVPQWLLGALDTHAVWIADHLEYYGGSEVGNHVLNNARALYFFGRLSRTTSYLAVASEIFTNELPRLMAPHGFLRESSSHYHFLVVRWLLEVYWLAQITGDTATKEMLASCLSEAVRRCHFFLVYTDATANWELPLIGDVSPDFPPRWLLDVPWSAVALSCFQPDELPVAPRERGWASLFDRNPGWKLAPYNSKELIAFPQDGWYRLNWGSMVLFWHVENHGVPLYPSHGHCDTGSFSLYVNGLPLLVDPGRYSYAPDGTWGVSARAHNSIQIDGVDPFVYERFYPPCYRRSCVQTKWEDRGTSLSFSIWHDGFGRMESERILFRREFQISKSRIDISDTVTGSKEHSVETFFQWGPEVKIKQRAGRLKCSTRVGRHRVRCRFEYDVSSLSELEIIKGESDRDEGWFFPAYGRKAPGTTVMLRQRCKLPVTNRYVIDVEV